MLDRQTEISSVWARFGKTSRKIAGEWQCSQQA